MVTKKDLIIAVLATFCLTATLFIILPSRSAEPYNPWADVSGPIMGEPDGTINMRDINYEIMRFNTLGDTTKNVTIAGHANKLAYTNSTTVSGNSYFLTPFISVDGYSKVTICIYNTAANNFYRLSTYHFESVSSFYVDTATDFGNDLVKTCDVPNQQIRVRFENNDATSRNLHIDVYLIP
jgi:hypothetical protein